MKAQVRQHIMRSTFRLPWSVPALLVLLVAPMPLWAAGPIPPCSPASADHCGFDRPEDLAMLPGGRWLAVSQKSEVAPLVLLDTVSGERVPATLRSGSQRPAAAWSDGACKGPPAAFDPAGIAVQEVDGQSWVAAINHAKPTRIELFALTGPAEQPDLEWRDCVAVPEQYALNDVALATDGSLYATHMFTPAASGAEGARLRARFLAAEPTGYALQWRRGEGWSKVPGTDLSFANGIALSNDGRWLAVSGTFDQAVALVDLARRERTGQRPLPRRVAVGLQPDNITPAGASDFVVAGHTGVPVTGVDPCRPPDSIPCGFAFAVAQLEAPVGEAAPLVTSLLRDAGVRSPGASVAVLDAGRLFLGSAFGDRVSVRIVAPAALRFSTVTGGGGVPINVVETGNPDGPAILFVHGMSQSYLAWLPQLRSSLAARYRLVAFDMRGHGGSGKPWRPEDYSDSKLWADDLAAVIADRKLEKPVVVAWSYGGHAVMSYVRHYGIAKLGALDFTGTLSGLRQLERPPGSATQRLLAGSRLRASSDIEDNVAGYRAMAEGQVAQPLSAELMELAFVTGLMQPSYVRRAMTMLPTRNADLAPQLKLPVLLSIGRLDREWPIDECREVERLLPDARLSVYEAIGHFPSAEAPERFNRELEALAGRVAGR